MTSRRDPLFPNIDRDLAGRDPSQDRAFNPVETDQIIEELLVFQQIFIDTFGMTSPTNSGIVQGGPTSGDSLVIRSNPLLDGTVTVNQALVIEGEIVAGSSGNITLQTNDDVDRVILDEEGVIYIRDVDTVPSANPADGVYLYANGGRAYIRQEDGTLILIATGGGGGGGPIVWADIIDVTATLTEINYVDGVTSNIQTQLDGKAATSHAHTVSDITGLTATVAELNFTDGVTSNIQTQLDNHTHNLVDITDVTATVTEINYVDGVTSNIQTQLDGKSATSHTHVLADVTDITATATEVNYTDGVTSNIQTQLDGKAATSHAHTVGDITGLTATVAELNFTDGVTSNIQTQLDLKAAIASPIFTGIVTLPSDAEPTVDTNGEIAIDTTVTDFSHGLIRFFAGEDQFVISVPVAELAGITNGQGIVYDATADEFTIGNVAAGAHTHVTADLSDTTVSAAELNFVVGVTSSIQTQLNGKANTSHTHTVSDLTDVTATVTELNYTDGVTSNIQTQLDGKAPLASPTFTGIVTLPTATEPSVTGNGDIAVDTTHAGFSHGLLRFFAGEDQFVLSIPVGNLASIGNGFIPAYNSTTDELEFVTPGGGVHTHVLADVTDITATATEVNYTDGVTSNIQTQLDGKSSTSHTHVLADVTDITATATEVNYTDGVTSNIQTQLDGKAASSHSHVLSEISDITATATEVNYTDGVTSNIQTQLDLKAPLASPTFTGIITLPSTTTPSVNSEGETSIDDTISGFDHGLIRVYATEEQYVVTVPVAVLDTIGNGETLRYSSSEQSFEAVASNDHTHTVSQLSDTTVTATEIEYVSGVTSGIQAQLNGKSATGHTHLLADVTDITATATEVNYTDGVTSNIQTQLDSKISAVSPLILTSGDAAELPLTIVAHASQTANRFETTTSGSTVGARITASGDFSNNQDHADGEAFGDGATSASKSVAVGKNASNGAIDTVAIGHTATASHASAIVIGRNAISTAIDQFIVGADGVGITDIYIGEGVTASSPSGVTYNASGGSGTNIAGANINIAGGKGTGSANGGEVIFKTSDAGGSGTTLQSLTEKVRVLLAGGLQLKTRATDPSTPAAGFVCLWISTGAGSGDAGNLMSIDSSGTVSNLTTLESPVTLTSTSAAQVPLTIVAHASQSGNMQEWENSSNTVGARVTKDQDFSRQNATGGSLTEQFGLNAVATGLESSAFGNLAVASGSFSSAFGQDSLSSGPLSMSFGASSRATGTRSTVFGIAAASTGEGVALGYGASASTGISIGYNTVSGSNAFALGSQSNAAADSIAIGFGSITTAGNQCVFGASAVPTTNVFFGKGVTNATPTDFTINGTGGSGTDIAGANVILAGGKGTGSAVGGEIVFQTSDAGASGTTLQSLTEKVRVLLAGGLQLKTRATDPSTPSSGFVKLWVSTGADSGDAGDIMSIDSSGAIDNLTQGANSPLTLTSNSGAEVPLTLVAHASQTGNRFETQTSGGTVGARITASGEFSNASGGSSSEIFGAGATATANGTAFGNAAVAAGGVAVGNAATCGTTSGGTALGRNAACTGNNATAVGSGASAGSFGTAVGEGATNTGSGIAFGRDATGSFAIGYLADSTGHTSAIAIGTSATASALASIAVGTSTSAGHTYSICIGHTATSTASNQLVIGSNYLSAAKITAVYIGGGVTVASPATTTYHASGGSGTNIAGADIGIAGGKGTGNAAGGNIIFSTSNATTSGTTLQSLTEKVRVDVAGGIVITEQAATPPDPASGTEVRVYMKGNYYVIQFYDGSTTKYRYIDLAGTDAVWTYSTTAP